MARFACSVLVCRPPGESRHTAFVVEANSKFEADGLALAIGRKLYPISGGFAQHHVVTVDASMTATLENSALAGEC